MKVVIIWCIIIFVLSLCKSNKKKQGKSNANRRRQGPVIGTPAWQTGRSAQTASNANGTYRAHATDNMHDTTDDDGCSTRRQFPSQPPRPVLRRSPSAERSEAYGTSPLDPRQPPSQTPLARLLDSVLLTTEDQMVDKQDSRDLPLEVRTPSAPVASTGQIMGQSLAGAFPKQAARITTHSHTQLPLRGRNNLRNAVLMAEVLKRPRAYDL